MSKRVRFWSICAAIATLSAVGARLLSFTSFFQTLNLKTGDLHFVVRADLPVPNIVLVTLDKTAFDTYSELRIFWNPYYADAIKAVGEGGAKVMGLDLAFIVPVEKWEPDQDRIMGEAVAMAPMPVVVGYVPELMADQKVRAIPINMISAATGNIGFTNMTVDSDDFLRNQVLISPATNPGDPPDRSLALRITEVYLGQDATFENERLLLAGKHIPISPTRTIAINYAGGPGTVSNVSIVKVLDIAHAARKGDAAARKQLHDWFEGKIVLLGTDSVDDRFNTPLYTLHEDTKNKKWSTAGVEVHANTINTILTGKYLLPVPEWVRTVALILATAVAAAISVGFSVGPASGLLLLEILLIGAITHVMFLRGMVLSTSETVAASVLCLVGSILYRVLTAEKRGNLFRTAVALFVSKQTAESLEKSDKIELSGKLIEVTILFTDIRGFTAYTDKMCEEEGPEKLVAQLNEYMADMVRIIVKYHGHVNKFIGDGILAVFSDDDPGSKPGDHPLRCVQCATEMVTLPSRFATGSGMHTGPVVVGNVGSSDKMEFTVLGDTVNLASRLESLNKEHHTKLLMTGTTQARLNGTVETSALGSVPVRGKSVPISLYTVTSLMPEPEAAATHEH